MTTDIVEPKPGLDVGRIVVDMHVENGDDVTLAILGKLPAAQVRSIDVQALVDIGATLASLTTSDIKRLGLRPVRQKRAHSAAGPIIQQIYSLARFTVEGRDCFVEVAELPDGSPALLGQIPLEMMDFWIDMKGRRLTGNPEHGGQWMYDAF
ncbi:MAG TPA: retropepsin-like aspartic protease [Gemmataceae bacterium]|nr:retropepsin-like aspartic protease [Gemmataceae bacterium]